VVVLSDRDQSIILFGGYNGHRWLNDLWKFDITAKTWTCLEESSPDNVRVAINVEDETNAAGIGMRQNNNNNNDNNNQASQQDKRPSCRFGYVSVVYDNKLVLWGGFDGQRWLNDMHIYDFSTSTWSVVEQNGHPVSPRSCPAWVSDGKYLYIQGGCKYLYFLLCLIKNIFFFCS
jgi:leucine-zipper-like transcriptional regulator 1